MPAREVCSPATTSTSGSRYTGLKGWPMRIRSGCSQPSWSRVGSRPEELEAITTSGPEWAASDRISGRFTSSSSGALSWIQSTRAANPSAESAHVRRDGSAPGNSPSLAADGQALRTADPSLSDAPGAGSQATTSWPRASARTAQPAPMTPVPTTPMVRGSITGTCLSTRLPDQPIFRVRRASAGVWIRAPMSSMSITALETSCALVARTPRSR